MGIAIVLEVVGKVIEELREENRVLKERLDAAQSRVDLYADYNSSLRNERDKLQAKVTAIQDYADNLARELENASNNEMKTLRALNFDKPDEFFTAQECENVSNEEEIKERGR